MILGTPTGFRATNGPVRTFRTLMFVVLCSGALAGLVLFAVQHFTLVPLIEAAEHYKEATIMAPTGNPLMAGNAPPGPL